MTKAGVPPVILSLPKADEVIHLQFPSPSTGEGQDEGDFLESFTTPHLNLLLQEESFRMNPARGEETGTDCFGRPDQYRDFSQ